MFLFILCIPTSSLLLTDNPEHSCPKFRKFKLNFEKKLGIETFRNFYLNRTREVGKLNLNDETDIFVTEELNKISIESCPLGYLSLLLTKFLIQPRDDNEDVLIYVFESFITKIPFLLILHSNWPVPLLLHELLKINKKIVFNETIS